MENPDLELSVGGGGGGGICQPSFLVCIFRFLPKIMEGGGGEWSPLSPSARSATDSIYLTKAYI